MNLRFTQYVPPPDGGDPFQKLLNLFLQLIQHTGGEVNEALQWMNELDKEYGLTNDEYGMGDFIEDLKQKGYLEENPVNGNFNVTDKTGQVIRRRSLEEIFGKLKKSRPGNHKSTYTGVGDELTTESRPYTFGDAMDHINVTTSLRNAQINHGMDEFKLTEEDLEIQERELKTQTSTVLMIDISHSMILYGEDRISPAKKVAMALSELITTKFPKDTLDIVVFGDDAWRIEMKDIPFLQVGPYHTNTCSGLELAMEILRRRKSSNKQVFMITDGKPTCLKEGKRYYKNSFGLDRKIVSKTLTKAAQCRRLNIPITTFMIADDPYLQQFVRQFTKINNGKAFYSSPDNVGTFLFEDFVRNRRKHLQ